MRKLYIINYDYGINGICSILSSVCNHFTYALSHGYIPIVDMKHSKNQYFKDNRLYKDNSWEYFFKQLCDVSLEDIKDDDEITLETKKYFIDKKNTIYTIEFPVDKSHETLDYLKLKEQWKSFVKFNPETQEYINNNYNSAINDKMIILGVLIRGSDVVKRRSYGEYIQPKFDEVVLKVKKMLKKYPQITNIYLATEDKEVYEKFKKIFGDKLIENKQYMFDYKKSDTRFLSEIKVNRPNHNYELAKEYLLSVYILSKCKYFIGGRCNGSKFAWILQDDWQDYYIWNLNSYGKSFKERFFSITTIKASGKTYKLLQILGLKIKIKVK